MSTVDFTYLRSIRPDVLERALQESGGLVGTRLAAGALVLKREFHGTLGWKDSSYIETIRDLQRLAATLCRWESVSRLAPRPDVWIRYRIGLGQLAYESHGSTGPCGCLWHRIWRMWLGELEDALSEW